MDGEEAEKVDSSKIKSSVPEQYFITHYLSPTHPKQQFTVTSNIFTMWVGGGGWAGWGEAWPPGFQSIAEASWAGTLPRKTEGK